MNRQWQRERKLGKSEKELKGLLKGTGRKLEPFGQKRKGVLFLIISIGGGIRHRI